MLSLAFINAPIIFILSLILTLSLPTTILAFSISGLSLLIGFNLDFPDTTLTSSVLTLGFSIASARFCSCNNLSIVCKRISLDKVLSSIKLALMKLCCSSVEDLVPNAFTSSSFFLLIPLFFLQEF